MRTGRRFRSSFIAGALRRSRFLGFRLFQEVPDEHAHPVHIDRARDDPPGVHRVRTAGTAGLLAGYRGLTREAYDRARTSLDRHATYIVAAFIAGLDPRARPQPRGTFPQAVTITRAHDRVPRRTLVFTSGWRATPFRAQYERLRQDPEWETREFVT
jgi:hypothetical protein